MAIKRLFYTAVRVAYDLFLKLNPRKLGAHAVILNGDGRVLLLRSRYADAWMLPGGGLEPREHIDEAVLRECREELGVEVEIESLTGLYYHEGSAAYVAVFRCRLKGTPIRLSHEHAEYRWVEPEALPPHIRPMVEDSLRGAGSPSVRRIR